MKNTNHKNRDNFKNLFIVDNEDEIYEQFNPRLRQKPEDVNVSITSPGLSEENTKRLTSQIQQIINEEISKNEQAKLQALKDSRQSTSIENKTSIYLQGLYLPEENRKRLTSQIQQIINEEISKNGQAGAADNTCVCACSGCPNRPVSYEQINLAEAGNPDTGHWVFPLPDTLERDPLIIAVFLWSSDRDAFRMSVSRRQDLDREIGPTNRIPDGEIWTSLKLNNVGDDWAKAIWAWDECAQSYPGKNHIYVDNNSTPPRSMRLYKNRGCQNRVRTLIFRKPGFFGVWYDVAHFSSDFWRFLNGTRVDFTWINR